LNKKVLIGQVLRPRGLRGELKTNAAFAELTKVYIDGREYKVDRSSLQNKFVYLCLAGVDSIEKAEKFRKKEIYVNENDLKIADDEVFADDLIGFAVLNANGEKIGKLKSVDDYGGGVFFEIAVAGVGYVHIPNEDEFITETNMKNKTITLTINALHSENVL
jgi:16S rRNA processing protein RimM